MRKPLRHTFEELVAENKRELLEDMSALDKIEERLEERQSREVQVKINPREKQAQN
ncbi:FbpB family small basic protein [Thalassorhabdus alkalitolerans]|uniref:FbpB family small basic protein n=1 Tax=Thalassorhabdus alkalitolerans TaxID=2282697 RepID=A0ABW0YP56_9BACI